MSGSAGPGRRRRTRARRRRRPPGVGPRSGASPRPRSSHSRMIRTAASAARTGYAPTAVSPRQHDRVRPVEDRVGHVARFGAGRPRRHDHRLEHLGRHDRRHATVERPAHELLLDDRDLLVRQLHAHVAAGDHHGVHDVEDPVELVDRPPGLDLGDDRRAVRPEAGRAARDVRRRSARTTAPRSRRRSARARGTSARSLRVSAGVETRSEGMLTPWRDLMRPPRTTSHSTSTPSRRPGAARLRRRAGWRRPVGRHRRAAGRSRTPRVGRRGPPGSRAQRESIAGGQGDLPA